MCVCDCLCVVLQAVSHLSRHQQEEYRWLKEQLRKKEMLQRKKKQQLRPQRTKPQQTQPLLPPLTQTPDNTPPTDHRTSTPTPKDTGEGGVEGTSSSERAVIWKDVGLLQIKVSNESALDISTESEDSTYRARPTRGDSSIDASATEDEDEETLRRMALLTQKKKTDTTTAAAEKQQRRVILETKLDDKDTPPETSETEGDTRLDDHSDESLRGEWMVLDEVREEGMEIGEEELCARPEIECSDSEREDCGEGINTSDSTESFNRSPMRSNYENTDGKQNTLKEEQEEECVTTKNELQISDENKSRTEIELEDGNNTTGATTDKQTNADANHTPEITSNEEKIEEVIRRIENRTRGGQEKGTHENPTSELKLKKNSITKEDGKIIKPEGVAAVEGKQPLLPPPPPPLPPTTTATTTATTAKINTDKRKEGKVTTQRIVISPDDSPSRVRKMQIVRSFVEDGQEEVRKEAPATVSNSASVTTTTTTTGTATVTGTPPPPQDPEKSNKMQLQLKKLEREYKEKK